MINLLKMERYRFFKNKSTYTTILAMIVFVLFFSFLMNLSLQMMGAASQQSSNQLGASYNESSNELGITGDSVIGQGQNEFSAPGADSQVESSSPGAEIEVQMEDIPLAEENNGEIFLTDFYSELALLLFIIILGSIFFTAPYRDGFIKNFIGLRKNRSSYIMAQFFIGVLMIFLLFLFSFLLLLVLVPRIHPDFVIHDYLGVMKVLVYQFALHIALMGMVLLIATITGSLFHTILISLAYTMFLYKPITDLLTYLLGRVISLPEDFHFRNYSIVYNVTQMNYSGEFSQFGNQALILGGIILVFSLLMSCLVINKKDY